MFFYILLLKELIGWQEGQTFWEYMGEVVMVNLATLLWGENKYQLFTDKQRYHTNASPKYFARQLENKVNAISLRVAWSVTCWDMRAIQLAQEFATMLNKHVNKCENPTVADLKKSGIGYNAE